MLASLFQRSFALRNPVLTAALSRVLTTNYQYAANVSPLLPEDVLETLASEHGGVIGYARAHPEAFQLSKDSNGLWRMRINPGDTPSTIGTVPGTGDTALHNRRLLLQLNARVIRVPFCAIPLRSLTAAVLPPDANPESPAAVSFILHDLQPYREKGAVRLVQYDGVIYFQADPTRIECLAGDTVNERVTVSHPFKDDLVPNYDMSRLARYLNCDGFTRVELLREVEDKLLSKSLAQVILSDRRRLFIETASPQDTLKEYNEWERSGQPARWPPPKFVTLPDDRTDSKETISPIPVLRGVKYCVELELAQLRAIIPTRYANMTFEELETVKDDLQRKWSQCGFRWVREKRRIYRAQTIARYPNGIPFLNPDVTAMYIYDNMEKYGSRFVRVYDLRRQLPDEGRLCSPTTNTFFDSYPHLFNIKDASSMDLWIQRADAGPRSEYKPQAPESLMLTIISAFPTPILEDRGLAITMLQSRLSRDVDKDIKKKFGSLKQFLAGFPEAFTIEEKDSNYVVKTSEERVKALSSKMLSLLGKREQIIETRKQARKLSQKK